ncbi:unnamed protein product [Mytilus coruscus]|uniref:Uncharacterized protein n=1 Tax=Mytilus coruscus TaxID=42192 RepID=A0A6J8BJM9_MYTCO|nr:unnamed protein product [Mytilus coruscus]
MWHDHSDILNHSYVNFMTTILYDAANFMTDNEYQTLARTTSTTNVQSIVEKPQLYILGRSVLTKICYRNTSENNHQKTVWLPFPQFSCTSTRSLQDCKYKNQFYVNKKKDHLEAYGELLKTTTNRKPGWIIDNTIIRYNAQQNSDDRSDSFAKARLNHQSPSDILDDLSTTEEPTMQDNEQEVEDPALILYDEESCSNQEEQTSILSDILPEQNKCPPIQESGKNMVTLTAEVHYAFEPCSGKKTPLDLAVQLLGKTPEVLECIKYKGLKQNHPLMHPSR